VITQVEKHLSNAYILDKYKWVAEYHNHKVPQFYDRNDYEENEWNELMEKISISMSIFPSYRSYAS
jgi:adenosylcobinamide amidohydrolase